MRNKIDIITLGCSKNLVDSELLIKQFEAAGFIVEHDSPNPNGKIVVINTCGFIGDAKEESINTILNFANEKKKGKIEKLFVMGCLSERYFTQLESEIPEVDKFYGKFNWKDILSDLKLTYRKDLQNERRLTTPNHYAYLKISEGCNRSCSYCAIPLMTGKHKSRSIESLLDETKRLAAKGVKELQFIAQDLTFYGIDNYRKKSLTKLVQQLSEIEEIKWIRLHYAYPSAFPLDILDEMAQNPKVCKYLDIPLQHISDKILKAMRRNFTKEQTYNLITKIREKVPEIHLRTSLIVGYPNETENDFNQLMRFVEDVRFERLGVFSYSHEEDTYAWKYQKDNVPQKIKLERANQIMELQRNISRDHNEQKIGLIYQTIIDRQEEDYYIGRTQFDSPEVDPELLIKPDKNLKIGSFYDVKIIGSDDYDLIGEIL
ncbi:MAG: 30S ribosomal protein S12 methylthiotransferase RimO [Marinilabiliaceae bacterium]|nr:30S ribosomal protein S12 methylthiotransferase RimO [Marinilabiliaceae bacterium]